MTRDFSTPALELTGLCKRYGDVIAVDNVGLTVRQGEVHGFIGPNGAGKTTTIRLVLSLIRPSAGSIALFGNDSRVAGSAVRARVGYLPAELALVDSLTGRGFLEWMCAVRRAGNMAAASVLAERLDLDLDRRIGELSSGNRRKVGLVQALVHDPDLVILDEPTSGLDPIAQVEFRRLVRELAGRGTTVFLSSHALHEVEDVCDRVATIADGRLRDVMDIAALRDQQRRHVRAVLCERPASPDGRRGVSAVTIARHDVDRWIVEFEVDGSMEDVAAWIGEHRIVDIRSEPLSLEQHFVEELGTGAAKSTKMPHPMRTWPGSARS